MDAYGAAGAPGCLSTSASYSNGGYTSYYVSYGGSGGLGGYIASIVDVPQGQKLYVDVGSWGFNPLLQQAVLYGYYKPCSSAVANQASGYNGGGGGLGGGASNILTIPFNLSSRIVVAGGGGSGPNSCTVTSSLTGFPGGGPVGGGGARGGTQTSAGVGCSGSNPAGFGFGGSPSTGSQGGAGGGGWYGGGAGCSSYTSSTSPATGGGGGSSYSVGVILANVQGALSPTSLTALSFLIAIRKQWPMWTTLPWPTATAQSSSPSRPVPAATSCPTQPPTLSQLPSVCRAPQAHTVRPKPTVCSLCPAGS